MGISCPCSCQWEGNAMDVHFFVVVVVDAGCCCFINTLSLILHMQWHVQIQSIIQSNRQPCRHHLLHVDRQARLAIIFSHRIWSWKYPQYHHPLDPYPHCHYHWPKTFWSNNWCILGSVNCILLTRHMSLFRLQTVRVYVNRGVDRRGCQRVGWVSVYYTNNRTNIAVSSFNC